RLEDNIPDIIRILSELPKPERLVQMLSTAGCAVTLKDIDLPEEIREPSIRLSPYVRNRLTFMRLLKLFELER
ncbi:MAG TPA: sn-glycerol-1-phosphate dehydrogenase, partial [Clostridia bacterium]|nr:sn-glycerol-1-phosphate dehydrogenase [Clostridia bacterium]